MNAETLEALNASIAKWDEIAKSGDENTSLGPDDCPLCKLFWGADYFNWRCDGCPVNHATRLPMCFGSPYEAASDARDDLCDAIPRRRAEKRRQFRKAAAAEALFLRALRPIGGV